MFFYLTINQVIEVIAFIEGLDLVSKPIGGFEKCAIPAIAKMSTCDQRYNSTLHIGFWFTVVSTFYNI